MTSWCFCSDDSLLSASLNRPPANSTAKLDTLVMYPLAQTLAADGSDREGAGVTPDLLVPLTRDSLPNTGDAQLRASIDYLRSFADR